MIDKLINFYNRLPDNYNEIPIVENDFSGVVDGVVVGNAIRVYSVLMSFFGRIRCSFLILPGAKIKNENITDRVYTEKINIGGWMPIFVGWSEEYLDFNSFYTGEITYDFSFTVTNDFGIRFIRDDF